MLLIATAALLVSQVVGTGLANPKELSFEELKALKVVNNNSTAAPTEYLISSLYADKGCSGSSYSSIGIGFGTCLGGSGYSVSYTNPSQDSNYLKYTYNYYTSNDCTGPVSFTNLLTFSFGCYPSDSYGVKYAVAWPTSSSPWEALGDGVLSQSFTDEKSCSSGGNSNTFSFSPLNTCLPATSTDGTAKSEIFTECGSTIDYTVFSDAECKNKESSGSGPLAKCYKGATDVKTNTCAKK